MIKKLEHALIVLRDLRRIKQDFLAANGCQPRHVDGLTHITTAIREIQKACVDFAADEDVEEALATEAVRHVVLRRVD
jgi:hypothetical protein